MQYGDWELRKNSSYYPAQNVILYPSSNSSDKGSLHVESNVRSIARRITNKSYKLHDNDFHVTSRCRSFSSKKLDRAFSMEVPEGIRNLYISLVTMWRPTQPVMPS